MSATQPPTGYQYLPPVVARDEFAKDWEAALRPDIDEYLARVHPELQDEASELMLEYLERAPSPPYSPIQMRRMMEQFQPTFDRIYEDAEVQAAIAEQRAEWKALPWHVRRRRRIVYRLWHRPVLRLKLRAMALRKQPWE